MNGVTQLLQAASAGDPRAAAERIDAAMEIYPHTSCCQIALNTVDE